MAETAQVTDASAFEKRSLGKQAVFAIVTVGLYSLYWFYTTAKQLDEGTDRSLSPVLAFIPFGNIVCAWQISGAGEAVTDQSQMALFLGFVFFGPLSWFWVQSGINEVAES